MAANQYLNLDIESCYTINCPEAASTVKLEDDVVMLNMTDAYGDNNVVTQTPVPYLCLSGVSKDMLSG